MRAFKVCHKIRQAFVGFTPDEVQEVLREKTYAGVMLKIDAIKHRHMTPRAGDKCHGDEVK